MGELATQAGRKVVAGGVVLIAAFVIFKVVVGIVTGIAWVLAVILAIAAIVWALRVL